MRTIYICDHCGKAMVKEEGYNPKKHKFDNQVYLLCENCEKLHDGLIRDLDYNFFVKKKNPKKMPAKKKYGDKCDECYKCGHKESEPPCSNCVIKKDANGELYPSNWSKAWCSDCINLDACAFDEEPCKYCNAQDGANVKSYFEQRHTRR